MASERGLLCVVDDAQWLDRESAAVLAFVARRLHADAIAILFAVREPSDRLGRVRRPPRYPSAGAARAGRPPAARRRDPATSTTRSARRIVAQTRGNPLALIEVGRELTPAQLAGGDTAARAAAARPPARGRVPAADAPTCPAGTQTLLLTAAAEPTGDPALLWRAGRDLGFTPDSAAPAQAGDLVVLGSVIRFRHPLVRSAIYHSAAPIERRRIHKALAAATDPGQDPDRRAWHLSEAAAEPDEGVAAGLERAADRAMIRGGWAASAAFLTRAAVLSPDPQTQARRLLAAARAESTAGDPEQAQVLLDRSRDRPGDPLHDGLATRAQGEIYQALSQPAEAAAVLLGAAAQLAPLDVRLARERPARRALVGRHLRPARARRRDGRGHRRGRPRRGRSRPEQVPGLGDLLLDAARGPDPRRPPGGRSLVRARGFRSPAVIGPSRRRCWPGSKPAAAPRRSSVTTSPCTRWPAAWSGKPAGRAPLSALAVALVYSGTSDVFAGSLDEAQAPLHRAGSDRGRAGL